MQQPNKAVISPELEGLMLIQQGLEKIKTQSSPPEEGGITTVLAQAKDAAGKALNPQQQQQQQQQQPNMAPPPGGPQMPPGGIAGTAQNAATGDAINQQVQQAQPQQQAEQMQQMQQQMQQMQQMQSQQPPQQMASGGIAGLPAENMRGFKGGGILNFDGVSGSLVPPSEQNSRDSDAISIIQSELNREESTLNRPEHVEGLKRELAKLQGRPVTYPPRGFSPQFTPEQKAWDKNPGNVLNAALAEAQNRAANSQDPMQKQRAMSDIGEINKELARLPKGSGAPTPRPELGANDPLRYPGQGIPAAQGAEPSAPQYSPPAPTGQFTRGAQPAAQPPGMSIGDVASQVNKAYPQDLTDLKAQQAQMAALQAGRPPVGQGNIDALTKAQLAEDALNKNLDESTTSRKLSALIKGFQTRNTGSMDSFEASEDARKRAQIALTLNRDELINAHKEKQHTQKIGDLQGQMAITEKITDLNQKYQKANSELAASVYASNERLQAANAAAKMQLGAQAYDKIRDNVRDMVKTIAATTQFKDAELRNPNLQEETYNRLLMEEFRKYKVISANGDPSDLMPSAPAASASRFGPRPANAVVRDK